MVAVGGMALGVEFAINHVIGIVVIIVDGVDVGGVAVAVGESESSERAGEVMVHCMSIWISMVGRLAVLRYPWCSAVVGIIIVGIIVSFAIIEADVRAASCCGVE